MSKITINGSIYKIRKMSGFAFVLVRRNQDIIQCIYEEKQADFSLEELKEGAWVTVTGERKEEPRAKAGFEVQMESVKIYSEPQEELPVVINQKEVPVSLETLLKYRPLTLRNDQERAIFKVQTMVENGFRSFLEGEQCTMIHTPKIVKEGAEGGSNIFALQYFGQEAYLAQSPQFYKQMMVGVFGKVYEIGPVFRAEKHDTKRHLNEYTGVDVELGFTMKKEQLMQFEERMIFQSLRKLQEEKELCKQLAIVFPEERKIPQIPFWEAKNIVAEGVPEASQEKGDLSPAEEAYLGEYVQKEYGSDFVFITEYTSSKRPFYAMDNPEDERMTESFDLLFRGLEITTGGLRIHKYEEQLKKMKKRGMDIEEFEHYLMIHKYGMPPHGGFGMGLERFVMQLLGLDNVRRASLFPRDVNRLVP